MTPEFPKRLHLRLNEKDWADLRKAKLITNAHSYAEVLREALTLRINVEEERILRMEQLLKDKQP